MTYQKAVTSIFLLSLSLSYTGCMKSELSVIEGGYYSSGIYFGDHLSSHTKLGIDDGCVTAQGIYSKNSKLFNSSIEYYNGWFKGRNKCKKLHILNKSELEKSETII